MGRMCLFRFIFVGRVKIYVASRFSVGNYTWKVCDNEMPGERWALIGENFMMTDINDKLIIKINQSWYS